MIKVHSNVAVSTLVGCNKVGGLANLELLGFYLGEQMENAGLFQLFILLVCTELSYVEVRNTECD